ncbi:MAG: hypothetical protein AVDCRST_MAG85-3022 [uncultured Solirubrobacteraceae bacterium]|uniref:RagB/SusD domain-containing protein n=1 Tax=uncultured Solirubrobacteraceae bacterium TaxID=1162706 RepID=A0A6J4TH60_9ACTN|nr:MAG: hypothetical protein AVDCRST_MAG85-3022 [uncultured Solirubrobacteraceae bacterium]
MPPHVNPARARARSRAAAALASVCLLGAVAGCDSDRILDVQDVDRLPPAFLDDPSFLPTVAAGAVRDFTLAYSGDDNDVGQILVSGMLTDEFYKSGTFPTFVEVDRRTIFDDNADNQEVFLALSRARRAAENAAARFEASAPTDVARAELLNFAGFTYVLFGENYCSGIPFSEFDEAANSFSFGPPLPTDSVLNRAIARFDAAAGVATTPGAATALNAARVGRARALLNLNRPAEAAAAVAQVPTAFRFVVEHSTNTAAQNNGQWSYSNNQGRWSVANGEGTNGLPYRTAFTDSNDTRVPSYLAPEGDATRLGFNRNLLRYQQMKYPNRESNVTVASGVEARLIEAEAALRSGAAGQFLAIHNALRANAALYTCPTGALGCVNRTTPLPPLVDPGTAAARTDLHFRERAFWLFATSHRLGDMRRLVRQYGRAANTVFPTGAYSRPRANGTLLTSGSHGTDTSLPVPVDELNNPEVPDDYSCDNTAP